MTKKKKKKKKKKKNIDGRACLTGKINKRARMLRKQKQEKEEWAGPAKTSHSVWRVLLLFRSFFLSFLLLLLFFLSFSCFFSPLLSHSSSLFILCFLFRVRRRPWGCPCRLWATCPAWPRRGRSSPSSCRSRTCRSVRRRSPPRLRPRPSSSHPCVHSQKKR